MMFYTSYLMSRVHIDQTSLIITILTVIGRNSLLHPAMLKFLKVPVKFGQLKSDSYEFRSLFIVGLHEVTFSNIVFPRYSFHRMMVNLCAIISLHRLTLEILC